MNQNSNNADLIVREDILGQAAFLLRIEKAKAFLTLTERDKAEGELLIALEIALQTAERAKTKAGFLESASMFEKLIKQVEMYEFMQYALAEIYMVLAICYLHLGKDEQAETLFNKAITREPDNQDIQEMGQRFGWQML